MATRIRGQFRTAANMSATLLATVDTIDSTITVTDDLSINFTLTEAQTLAMSKVAYVDFSRLDGGVWSLLPGRIPWPIWEPITAPLS